MHKLRHIIREMLAHDAIEQFFNPVIDDLKVYVHESIIPQCDRETSLTKYDADTLELTLKTIASLTREFWDALYHHDAKIPRLGSMNYAMTDDKYFLNLRIFFRSCGIQNATIFANLVTHYQMGKTGIISSYFKHKNEQLQEAHDYDEQEYEDIRKEVAEFVNASLLNEIIPYDSLQDFTDLKLTVEQAQEIFITCKIIAKYIHDIKNTRHAILRRNYDKVNVLDVLIRNILRDGNVTDLRLLTIYKPIIAALVNNPKVEFDSLFNTATVSIINESNDSSEKEYTDDIDMNELVDIVVMAMPNLIQLKEKAEISKQTADEILITCKILTHYVKGDVFDEKYFSFKLLEILRAAGITNSLLQSYIKHISLNILRGIDDYQAFQYINPAFKYREVIIQGVEYV